ncbi:ABC transporter ATP-binding protein [Acidisoma sp. 7E03]
MQLTLHNVSCGYGRGAAVVHGVSTVPIPAGRMVALLGPNGAGKSTLLKGIAGLLPTRGKVIFGPHDLGALPPAARASILGFMPQVMPASTELTVLESLIATLEAMGPSYPESTGRQAAAVLEECGIASLALRPLRRLSGGQKQLVSFAQTVARDAPLLCLDEPTSALDPRHQMGVMALARRRAEAGALVLVVLHDLALAARWADEILVMRQGGLYAQGTPEAVMTPGMLRAVYGVHGHVERGSTGALHIQVTAAAD